MTAPNGKTSLAARVGQHTVRLRYRRRVADSDALIGSVPPTPLTRRVIIGFGLTAPTLAVPWLAGCASKDSVVDSPAPAPGISSSAATSGATASPGPTTAASNPTAAQAESEQALAALAAAIVVGPHRNQLSKEHRRLLTFLRDVHTAHAESITNPAPTPPPVSIGGTLVLPRITPPASLTRPTSAASESAR